MTELKDPGTMREERKAVTALDADVVGSTALAERLDPEDVKLLVGEAVTRMVAVVEELGGTVKDLAGDGVLALFGAPAAHEDDAERAVMAALHIVEETEAHGSEVAAAWGIEGFSVRVGVNTGTVVLGPVGGGDRVEYGAVGDSINTASRLQAAARPGSVLVGEATHRLVEPLFEWSEERVLSVKGKADEIVAYEATGLRPVSGKLRGLEGAQAPLVGRERELTVAQDAIDAVLEGTGGIVFVIGEAGIGKSRLVAELRERLESSASPGARPLWLEGRCVSYGESLPYWPFRDLLREWLGVSLQEPELRLRVALRRSVEQLFGERALEIYPYLGAILGLTLEPDAAARLAELAPEALQYRTFEVVRTLVERLAADHPVVLAIDDLHWADPTSIQLAQQLLGATESAAVLLVIEHRPERDHPSWKVKTMAGEEYPHRTRELALEALSGDADRELLHSLVGESTLPPELDDRILAGAEGNPFFLEELVGSLVDAGVLRREDGGWRFERDAEIVIPPTVEKVILARIDRLPDATREVLTAASVLGRRFGLPLLRGVTDGNGTLEHSLHELQRLDLLREARRWPEPEFRFKHAVTQEVAYRTLLRERRTELHRRAAEWLEQVEGQGEEQVLGLLAHHWLAAEDEEKAVSYLTRAGDRARQEYALDEAIGHYQALLPLLESRGEQQAMALVLFKLALALHTSMRFKEANETYARAFEHWTVPPAGPAAPTATLRMTSSFLPNDPDPKSAIAWPNIQLCMQLFDRLVEAWPERTLVPSLAERWEIAEDGLRYVFHLREGLSWSDGAPLTAHDVEYGIKRVLDPESPGSSVAIYFVLENGQDYYLGRNRDADRLGVRALDDHTVEFRLVAPAPYFMSVMNRPDSGPQPRHAIEAHGDAWVEPQRQVVSGPFRQDERTGDRLVLVRRQDYDGSRSGNVARVEMLRSSIEAALEPYTRDELDVITVRYTPRLADLLPGAVPPDARMSSATWSAYIAFDHAHPVTSNVELRRALAYAIDRDALREVAPANLIVSTGGIVPPALQGHTPDIALRFDAELAREHLRRSRLRGPLQLGGMEVWSSMLEVVAGSWQSVLGIDVRLDVWSWQEEERRQLRGEAVPSSAVVKGWLPGYPDPEYYLRLLLHSDSRTNEGGFAHPSFDELIERARRERDDRSRLEFFHEADRMAVVDQVALIPLVYARNVAFVKPWVRGWWEFGKSSASFADLVVTP